MNQNRKLKNFIIYPQFQTKMIAIILFISLLAPLIILGFQLYSFHMQMQNVAGQNLDSSHPYFIFYNDFQRQSLFVFGIAITISFILSVVIGLVVSHRIAGPLVKMKNHFEAVGLRGESDHPIYFRDGDFFRELSTAYNLKFENKKTSRE